MKKVLFVIGGIISVALGVMGIFLPVLPTTPFLLLASYLFLKSSDRLYNWLMDHPVLGLYVKSYIKYRGVEKKHKILAIITLWSSMALSMYLVDVTKVRIMLIIIGIGVTIHLVKLRNLTREEVIELEKLEDKMKSNSKRTNELEIN